MNIFLNFQIFFAILWSPINSTRSGGSILQELEIPPAVSVGNRDETVPHVVLVGVAGLFSSMKNLEKARDKMNTRYTDDPLDGLFVIGGGGGADGMDISAGSFKQVWGLAGSLLSTKEHHIVAGGDILAKSKNNDPPIMNFPSPYYFRKFINGNVIVCTWILDTENITECGGDQLKWFEESLRTTHDCTWKIAIGYNHMTHLVEPILDRGRVDIYLSSGGEPINQVFRNGYTVYVITGDMSKELEKYEEDRMERIFSDSKRSGFIELFALENQLNIYFHSVSNNPFKKPYACVSIDKSSVAGGHNRIEVAEKGRVEEVLASIFPRMIREPYSGELRTGGAATQRFALIGDWGKNSKELKLTSSLLRNPANNLDTVLLLGDSFYPRGILKSKGLADPQFRLFSNVLAGDLRVPFFTIFGNHDYLGSLEAQFRFHENDPRWNFPTHYYKMRFVQATDDLVTCVWFLDTNRFEARQLDWLRHTLIHESMDCTWRLVIGHHPLYSGGEYSDSRRVSFLRSKILPVFREGNVDAYLSGHEHSSQFLMDKDFQSEQKHKPAFIITGRTADKSKLEGKPKSVKNCLWRDFDTIGFPLMIVSKDKLVFEFKNANKPYEESTFKEITITKISTDMNEIILSR